MYVCMYVYIYIYIYTYISHFPTGGSGSSRPPPLALLLDDPVVHLMHISFFFYRFLFNYFFCFLLLFSYFLFDFLLFTPNTYFMEGGPAEGQVGMYRHWGRFANRLFSKLIPQAPT